MTPLVRFALVGVRNLAASYAANLVHRLTIHVNMAVRWPVVVFDDDARLCRLFESPDVRRGKLVLMLHKPRRMVGIAAAATIGFLAGGAASV